MMFGSIFFYRLIIFKIIVINFDKYFLINFSFANFISYIQIILSHLKIFINIKRTQNFDFPKYMTLFQSYNILINILIYLINK